MSTVPVEKEKALSVEEEWSFGNTVRRTMEDRVQGITQSWWKEQTTVASIFPSVWFFYRTVHQPELVQQRVDIKNDLMLEVYSICATENSLPKIETAFQGKSWRHGLWGTDRTEMKQIPQCPGNLGQRNDMKTWGLHQFKEQMEGQ